VKTAAPPRNRQPRAGRSTRGPLLPRTVAVGKSRSRKRAARLRRCTSAPPCTTPSRRTACLRRSRWPFLEPTLTGDPAGSPGVFPDGHVEEQNCDATHLLVVPSSCLACDIGDARSLARSGTETCRVPPTAVTSAACPGERPGPRQSSVAGLHVLLRAASRGLLKVR
jgi:hypothetical protein